MKEQQIPQQIIKEIINNLKQNVQNYKQFKNQDFVIQKLGGITNLNYKVSSLNKEQNLFPSIIYRKLSSSKKNIFLNRETEKNIYQCISNAQLGPKIYGYIGKNVRIQQFIQSSMLQPKKMLQKSIIENVSFILSKFHSLSQLQQVQRISPFRQIFLQKQEQILEICHNKLNKQIYNEQQKKLVNIFKNWVTKQQINFFRKAVIPLQKQNITFSHNDLLASNILIKKSDNRLIFIDYEYASFNYQIFDISNYFNQSQFDYEINEPPYFKKLQRPQNFNEMKQYFIQCYCLAQNKSFQEYKNILNNKQEKQKVKQKINKLIQQFPLGSMLSNLMWGWWAIIMSKNQKIQFDYLKFCKIRYDNYMKIKNSQQWKIY